MGVGRRILARPPSTLPSFGGKSLDRTWPEVTSRMVDIIVMRDQMGMVWRDIAVKVGIQVSFAKTLYARARVILEDERQRSR